MTVLTLSLSISTRGNTDIQDITSPVAQAVGRSGLQDGAVTIFCPSSTSAVTTIEYETGVLNDLRRLFDEIIDPDIPFSPPAETGDTCPACDFRYICGTPWVVK